MPHEQIEDSYLGGVMDISRKLVDESGHHTGYLAEMLEGAASEIDILRDEKADLQARAEKAESDRDEARREHEQACLLVAKIHFAATGSKNGPKRGVIEDIEDLAADLAQVKQERDDLRLIHTETGLLNAKYILGLKRALAQVNEERERLQQAVDYAKRWIAEDGCRVMPDTMPMVAIGEINAIAFGSAREALEEEG